MKNNLSFSFLIFSMILYFSTTKVLSQSQNYQFEQITIQQSGVQCIIQDKQGFLWFGTQEGLNRFDGYSVNVYKYYANNINSFPGGRTLAMLEDKNGVLWVGTEIGVNKFLKNQNKWINYRFSESDSNTLNNNEVNAILEDSDGTIWVLTRGGLNKYNKEKDDFIRYDDIFRVSGKVQLAAFGSICEDRNKNFWISHGAIGLIKFNKMTSKCTYYQLGQAKKNSLSGNFVASMSIDKDDNLWILTDGGLDKFNLNENKIEHFKLKTRNREQSLLLGASPVYLNRYGKLYIAGSDGLYIFNKEKNCVELFSKEFNDYIGVSEVPVSCIFEDRNGILWVGTFTSGIYKYDMHKNKFSNIPNTFTIGKEKISTTIWGFAEIEKNVIWFPSETKGLIKYDRSKNLFSQINLINANRKIVSNSFFIFKDRQNIAWMGSDLSGLCGIDSKTLKLSVFNHDPKDPSSISNHEISSVYEDRSGFLWVGTRNGLNKFDRNTKKFKRYRYDSMFNQSRFLGSIYAITEDDRNNIWLGTRNGLFKFDKEKEKFTDYIHDPKNQNSVIKGLIAWILYDSSGIIWIAGMNGLCKFEISNEKFTHFTEKEGLPNNCVYAVLRDKEGNLWLSTNNGISKYSPKYNTFTNYDETDGLQGNEFNQNAFYQSDDGELYFGGVKGISSFYPENITTNTTIPDIAITSVRKFDQTFIGDKDVNETKEIEINYDENFFSFEFAALNYSNSKKNQYAYMMEGFDKNWIYCGTKRMANYTNLDPGEYTFRVKGSNNNGLWNEAGTSIKVRIKPPYWKTWWFQGLGILLIISMGYIAINFRIKNIKSRSLLLERQVEERTSQLSEINQKMNDQNIELKTLNESLLDQNKFIENQNDELKHLTEDMSKKNKFIEQQNNELIILKKDLEEKADQAEKANRAKSEFLANMSHEIRTPMNAILGFAEILSTKETNSEKKNYTNIILSSGNALLTIINDILDLSKIEAGKLILQPTYIDLKKIVEEIKQLFTQKANEKGLEFLIEVSDDLPKGIFLDEVRTRQVIMNILGNAIKFTEKGYIKISVGARCNVSQSPKNYCNISITIEDTGIGIPKEQIEKIFRPFEQVEGQSARKFGGTGLGLSISTKLIKMMGGEISATSPSTSLGTGKGSIFTIALPGILSLQDADTNLKDQKDAELNVEFEPSKILVVDDVLANRELIKAFLKDYNLIIKDVESGKQTIEEIRKDKYDLLLLDWKMPDMDGEEVAKILKEDESTKDIPLVILTASALKEEEERITKTVNGFLTKPLNKLKLVQEIKKYLPFKEKEKVTEEVSIKDQEGIETLLTPEQKEKLISKLENEHKKEWESVSKTKAMGSVKIFAINLQKTAEEYDSVLLKKYSNELLESVNSFKVAKVKTMLNDFPKVIEKINYDF